MKVRFGPGGWVQWPDNEEFSIEFMRLLGAAQEGGSMISECFLAASRIDPKDARRFLVSRMDEDGRPQQ